MGSKKSFGFLFTSQVFPDKIALMANRMKINGETVAVGDQVVVYQKIQEGKKTRRQPFSGRVISLKGRGENKMLTVRKIGAGGIGVERLWPVFSPWLEKIVVKKRGQARRGKLYYLRQLTGKKATRVKTKK